MQRATRTRRDGCLQVPRTSGRDMSLHFALTGQGYLQVFITVLLV
jgi:hypothetical protein